MYCRFSSLLVTLFIYISSPPIMAFNPLELMLERPLPLPLYRRNSAALVRSVQVKRFELVHDESADEFERGEAAAGGGGANM